MLVHLSAALDTDDLEDALQADGPFYVEGVLQAMLDEQAPGLALLQTWDWDDGIVAVVVETEDAIALREATDPIEGNPTEDALWAWQGTKVASHNPVWPANLGHGELSELHSRN